MQHIVEATPEKIARRFGFDRDRRVRVADLASWYGNSTASMRGMLRNRGIEITAGKVPGRVAAEILVQQYSPKPANEDAALVILRNRDGEKWVRMAAGSASAATSVQRLDGIRQFLDNYKGEHTHATFYGMRHAFQTVAASTPGVSGIVVKYMMGHLGSRLVKQYTDEGLLPEDQIAAAVDNIHQWLFS